MKLYKRAIVKNEKVHVPFTYLNKARELNRKVCGAKTAQDFFDLNLLEEALEVRAIHLILSCMELLKDSNAPEKTKQNDLFTMELQAMTSAHFKLITFIIFKNNYARHQFKSQNIMKHIELLQRIYCLNEIMEDS